MEKIILIEQYRNLLTNKIDHFEWCDIPDFRRYTDVSKTLLIIYPKGQRPNLPYPKNEKK